MKESELGRTYKDGEIICQEGDVGESMFVIQSGTVEVSKKHNGGEMVLRTMTKGEIFCKSVSRSYDDIQYT
jgi:CRP-like cAMP-binding protein